ncbi:hypothetical protein ATCC90586_002028 [Pythium insidiosum]|nr:hypothetical protein ATCC90586_002028 [Pythium insidiosum]
MSTNDATRYAISLESIQAAARRIDGLAHRTPVLTCATLDAVATQAMQSPRDASETPAERPVRLFFKCENFQKIGAFKYRGATNAIRRCLEEQPTATRTFVTHSSGNHAQAVALAARDAHCSAVIVMPENAPLVKQQAVRGYGAEIVFAAATVSAREEVAAQVVERTSGHFIHPSDDVDVMSGQGTVALELIAQVEQQFGTKLDAVVVPVGGGGLCSGVAMAVKSMDPSIKVFAVEPEGAADASISFRSRELQGHATPPQTIADGLRTTLGENNFPVIRDQVDDIVLVGDDEIVAAMRLLWERMKIVVEPSGAVSAAGVLFNKMHGETLWKDRQAVNIGVVLSGGNVDLESLPWMAAKA